MKTIKEFERETGLEVPNYYLYNGDNGFGSIRIVSVPLTPLGKISKKRPHIAIMRRKGLYADLTLQEAFQEADKLFSKDKLPKGYSWTETLLQFDFWYKKGEKI